MANRLSEALERARSRPDFINLIDTNFHSCGLLPDSVAIASAARRYLDDSRLRPYQPEPAGLSVLREVVSQFYEAADVDVAASDVIVTASASESYSHIFAGLCERGGEVLLPRPGYPLFEDVALRCGLHPRFYDLRFETRWSVDPEQLDALVGADTVAIVLISPNNPTGSIASTEEIVRVGEICSHAEIPLIVDEVFSEYRFAKQQLPRPAALCPETLVLTINGASKLLVSPDLKVSWIAITGPAGLTTDAREQLEVENDLYLNASPINQYVAASLLRPGADDRRNAHGPLGAAFIESVVAEVGRRRAVMLSELQRLAQQHPGTLSWVDPAGGIHLPVVFTEIGIDTDDEEIAVELLDGYSLAAHPGYLYGVDDTTLVVLSYLSPPQTIRAGLGRLEDFLTRRSTS
jgi:aspartate/methionine/tyrosine aminotransferase